jgi:hypothetical protein
MTLESRNSPFLANGSLTHVFVTTRRNNPLLGNGSASTFRWQRMNTEKQNNRGTQRHGVLYSVRPEFIKGCGGGVIGVDERGSLKSEVVKYGRESHGSRTRE